MRRPLFVWRDGPLDLERPLWAWVANQWGNEVTVVSTRGFSPERAQLNWGNDPISEVVLGEMPDAKGYLKERATIHADSVNVFYGFRGGKTREMRRLWHVNPTASVSVIAERPTAHNTRIGPHLKSFASAALYRSYAVRYGSRIGAFLAMGTRGVDEYAHLGFDRSRLFNFMYAPRTYDAAQRGNRAFDRPVVKFLYVGRLDARFKGVDVLLEAVSEGLDGIDWSLDIVGGYGDLIQGVTAAADASDRIDFRGPWPAGEVVSRMADYDVCLVPSRYDGWNVTTNQAINAGLAVIAAEGATSDELVSQSGAGLVVPAGNTLALRQAIRQIATDPELLAQCMGCARRFAPRIAVESVGSYVIDVLTWANAADQTSRPACPWLLPE